MTTDPFAHDDAAYVLGALGPAERRAFEEHLADCAACTRAVADLAGLPSLLAQVDETAFAGPDSAPPLPETMLPRLLEEVRRRRRRLRLLAAIGAGAAAAVLAVVAGVLVLGGSGSDPATPPQAMAQVSQEALSATVSFEDVAWGTRLRVACTYESGGGWEGDSPAYALVVTSRSGVREQVATWRAVPDKETRLEAATAVDADDIARVDVVLTSSGKRLLTLERDQA